jgi:hypothetical protein
MGARIIETIMLMKTATDSRNQKPYRKHPEEKEGLKGKSNNVLLMRTHLLDSAHEFVEYS